MNKKNTRSYLTDYSVKDKPWDVHKAQADDVGGIYAHAVEFEHYASRVTNCCGYLYFAWNVNQETGETKLNLTETWFCRCRHCPICQWRRALMWQARFYKSLPQLVMANLSVRWLFLTLTIRNCAIENLGSTLTSMNTAFKRLSMRKEFKPVIGWLRTTEVTRGRDGSAHPHFHTLMMVPSYWFKVAYVKQSRWVELWQDCLQVDYPPNVDIRSVKVQADNQTSMASLQKAVAETLKYAVKPADMVIDSVWFLELTRQTFKRRFVAAGGVLKEVLKVTQESNQDLLLSDEQYEQSDENGLIAFDWQKKKRRYQRRMVDG